MSGANDREVDELNSVSCAVLLERQASPYPLDKSESTRDCLKYRRGKGDIILVTHGGRGWWDPRSATAKGDIFNLVQHLEPGLSFGQARKVLRDFVGIAPSFPPHLKARDRSKPEVPVQVRWDRRPVMWPGSPGWKYLTATLTASRLFTMAHERGYRGSPDHFRHVVAEHRPRRPAEAFLRLRSLPGEQGQVDWGHFGTLQIGRARRPLTAFVMVLSHSHQIFLRFYLDARMENFLRGHVGAFTAWNGVPRVLLYDNLKSAVLERRGDAIRFHPTLLGFAGHYRYEPRPVAVARGNEKGRVERSIGYIRSAFFAACSFADLDDLNAQADDWCHGLAADRRCPGEPDRTVRDVFADEVRHLLSLPDNPVPLLERVAVKVDKTPYVRFDLNDYSVPHTHVRRTLTVLADTHELRIVDGAQVIACHHRSYDRGEQIEQTEHLQALIDQKRGARQHRATNRLAQVAPASQDLLVRAAERGANLGAIAHGLMRLLDRYGAADLQAAIREALERDVPHPNAVRLALERRREQRGKAPPVDIELSADVRARDAPVQPHALETYDELKDIDDE